MSVVWTAGDSGKNTGSLWAYEHTSLWELLQLQLLRLPRRCFRKLSSLLVKDTFRQSSQRLDFKFTKGEKNFVVLSKCFTTLYYYFQNLEPTSKRELQSAQSDLKWSCSPIPQQVILFSFKSPSFYDPRGGQRSFGTVLAYHAQSPGFHTQHSRNCLWYILALQRVEAAESWVYGYP